MKCPKCGQENDIGAKVCIQCKDPLSIEKRLGIRVSRVSLVAIILSIISIAGFAVFFLMALSEFPGASFLAGTGFLAFALAGFGAVVSGIAGIIHIYASGGKRTGEMFAVIAVVSPVLLLGLMMVPALLRVNSVAFYMVCMRNLSEIGKATSLYAADYEDILPHAGDANTIWAGHIPNWKAEYFDEAYGINPGPGQGSISASLYLLIKHTEVTPKTFLCKGDSGVSAFDPNYYRVFDKDLTDLWDFGPKPWEHCSYAYHTPYGKYPLTTFCNPRMAVAADRNPFQDNPSCETKDIRNFSFKNRESIKQGNACQHQDEMQIVLFLDGNVKKEKTPACGINEDNIYTIQDGNDIRIGKAPIIGSEPASRQDSLLVTDGKGD